MLNRAEASNELGVRNCCMTLNFPQVHDDQQACCSGHKDKGSSGADQSGKRISRGSQELRHRLATFEQTCCTVWFSVFFQSRLLPWPIIESSLITQIKKTWF